jgi:hypothetical protein
MKPTYFDAGILGIDTRRDTRKGTRRVPDTRRVGGQTGGSDRLVEEEDQHQRYPTDPSGVGGNTTAPQAKIA